MNGLVDERALLHVLLLVLEDKHLHAFLLEIAKDVYEAIETVRVVRFGLPLSSDHVDELLELVLLEVIHLVAVHDQVYGAAGWTSATHR